MICVLEGESVYEIGGERLHLQAGDVLCLPRGCGYRRRVFDVNYKTVFVYFYYDAPDEALPPYQFWRATEGLDLHFLRLYKKWVAHDLFYQSDCMSIFYQILGQLNRSAASGYLPQEKRTPFELAMRRIADREEASVAALAAQAGMSEVHFRRCFKKIFNTSPQEYAINLRLARAKELLQYDGGTVAEIAEKAGFADAGYFARLFKRKTGFTPSEYRKQFSHE